MSYTALYRQWRPKTFGEVVGQSHVTVTLQNAIRSGKVGHAYLFAGPRGTGKTSVAKILARAVNCLKGPAAEPCNDCPACLSVLDGSATDVIEIDAASNRGIDEIRDLRNKVKFCPANLKYKVYIIDEVHMLTPEAFNALLKTLEEPPSHAIFILATTEPHKIPATVLSRCQRFGFHRISSREVLERLEGLSVAAGLNVAADALKAIARASDGSLRDALSLLDQCASFSDGEVNASHVRAILGNAGAEGAADIAAAIARGDTRTVLETLERLSSEGKDLRQFNREITSLFRDILVLKVCKEPGDLVDRDPETVGVMKELAASFSEEEILRAISAFGEVDSQMRHSGQPRICMEIGLLKILRRPAGAERRALSGREAVQQQRVTAPVHAGTPTAAIVAVPKAQPAQPERARAQGPGALEAPPAAARAAGNRGDAHSLWQAVIARLKKERKAKIAALLDPARPVSLESGVLTIAFGPESQFHKSQIEDLSNLRVLEATVKILAGQDLRVCCISRDPGDNEPCPGGGCGEADAPAAGALEGPMEIEALGVPEAPGGDSAPPAAEDHAQEKDIVQDALELFDGEIVSG